MTIGLTGGIGSGKSTVADLFAARGVPIIDTDAIAHQITAPQGDAMAQIAAQFGDDYVTPEGALDRGKMRALVFQDDTARERLQAITHPLIRAATTRLLARAQAANHPYAIIVIPLLVESASTWNWKARITRVLVVDCSIDTQIARVMHRNGFTRDEALAIIHRQAPREARLAAADDVIVNDGASLDALAREVDALHQCYCMAASGC